MGAAGIHGSLILNVSLKAKHSGWCFEAAGHWGHLLSQGRQTHFHRGPLQPHGFLQRAEIILGLCKCNYSLTVKELKLHSALWRHPRGWCGPWWTWVYMGVLYVDVHMLQMRLCVECQQVAARGRLWHRSDVRQHFAPWASMDWDDLCTQCTRTWVSRPLLYWCLWPDGSLLWGLSCAL